MTSILKVITEYCEPFVDDIRTQEHAHTDPPLYAQEMWSLLRPALPLFNKPVEMEEFLLGTEENPNIVEPIFDSYLYTVVEDMTAPFEVSFGAEYSGYDMCAGRLRLQSANGTYEYFPIPVEYDPATGSARVIATETRPIDAGLQIDFDFFTDGYFKNTLSRQQMRILGLCFQVQWQNRFNMDWLSMVSKNEDKSSYEQNRANKMNSDGARYTLVNNDLKAALRNYEQSLKIKKNVPRNRRTIL